MEGTQPHYLQPQQRVNSSSYLLNDWVILFIGHTRGEPAVQSLDSICKGAQETRPVSQSFNQHFWGTSSFLHRSCTQREESTTNTDPPTASMVESTMDNQSHSL